LGDEDNAIQTHSVLVNRDDVEEQIHASQENTHALANSPFGLPSIKETSVEKHSKGTPSVSATKKVNDDSDMDHMEVTVSFADQLQQLEQLQKTPYKVPPRNKKSR
jgi:hypothetical protein